MINELLLLSGIDLPFIEAQLIVHQPSIKEIAYIGEEAFYTGCEFLKFSKDNLKEEDRINLEKQTNFDILMSISRTKNIDIQKNVVAAKMVLGLMFPNYHIDFQKTYISIKDIANQEEHKIDNSNYPIFLEILNSIFCLVVDNENNPDYNPGGTLAKKIAEKLNKRHQKLATLDNQKQKVAILSRYISILAVGQQRDINSYMKYTVYQLFDEFTRYELKLNYDIYFEAKMAGAKDLKEVDDWMKDIHP